MGKADHTALSKVFANRIKELGYSNTHHYTGVLLGHSKSDRSLLHLAIVMSGSRIIRMFLQDKNSRNIVHGSGPYNLSFPGVSGTFDMSSDYQKYFTGRGQGGAIPDNRYATITKDNYTYLAEFFLEEKADSKRLFGSNVTNKISLRAYQW